MEEADTLMVYLLTGGTGSFGHRFTERALKERDLRKLIILSRDEFKLYKMRQEFPDPRMRFFIGDVRDLARLKQVMEGTDIVVHAAALKHVPVAEYNPFEAVKTNVIGAMNVIEAAQDAGVRKVVALSSDKAYQPISAYGQSKALMESLMLAANHTRGANGPIFAVTRYGNVAGSAGSVIPIWRATDYPLITDSECTRFWMTMDQAIDLVLNTVRTMKGGELAIPTLPAYRLGDLLVAMGKNPAEQVGLNPYEKKQWQSAHNTQIFLVLLSEINQSYGQPHYI